MNNNHTYQQLVEKMHDVSALPPQTMGPLTYYYRLLVPFVKTSPWKVLFAGSFTATLLLYSVFGAAIVYIASILQHGF